MKKIIIIFFAFISINCFGQVNHNFFTVNEEPALSNDSIETESNQNITEVFKPEVRPFITDDARVVGKRLAQLETWIRIDKEAKPQWVMAAYGPSNRLEVSLGGVFGFEKDDNHHSSFAYALPLLQAK